MSLLAQINNAAHTGAFGHNPRSEPTLAQLAAGNYKKGVVMVKGLSIAIENPAYTYRKGMDKTGQQWMCLMQAHYGYIQGHKGNDGDDMDVFIGVAPENDTVYIVNQKTADGYFDEHKIMLGFLSQQQAVDTYQHCFERGWTGLMSVVPCTMTQFKWWLANGNKSRPVTLDRLPYAGLERLDSVNWGGTDGSNLYSHDGQLHKLLYQIRQCDDTHQALEPLAYHDMIAELGNQGFMYENYDALIVEYNKLEKKAKQLLMVMQGAADTVKPVGVTVSKPLTKGGVANVVAWFEMDDGQAVGVFFHNPDKTPKKINPTDEMISYKWVLNKKDITIAVAPEQGKDLIIRTVAKRIMQLVEKNHDRFIKANGDKAALNQAEQDLTAQVAEKQATLKGLQDEVAALQGRKAEKEALAIQAQAEAERLAQEQAAIQTPPLGFVGVWDSKSGQYPFQSITGSKIASFATREEAESDFKASAIQQPSSIDYSKYPVIATDDRYGQIIEVPTIWGDKVRVAKRQLENSGRTLLKRFTKAGAEIEGDSIHRENLLIGNAKLTEMAQIEKELKEKGYKVAPFPKSKQQEMKLIDAGYIGYSLDGKGWIKPSFTLAVIYAIPPISQPEPVTLTGKELENPTPPQERPLNWRTNLANARAVAKSLGIETKGKKLERLIKDVDIFDDNEVKKELLVEFKGLASRLVLPKGYIFDLSDAEKSIGDITRSTAAWIRKQGKIDTNTIRVELRTIPDSSQGIIFNSVHIYTDDPKMKKDFDKFSYQRFGDIGASSPETPKEIIAKMELFLTKAILPEIEYQKVKNSTTLDTVDLPSLGVANIESIGDENIYIEKDGKYYISKVGNTENYALGEWDFAKYPEGKPAPVAPVTQPVINRAFVKRFTELAKAAGAENVFSDEAQGNATAHFSNEATKKVSVVEIDISADILPPAGDVWAFERNSKIEVSDGEGNMLATFNPTEMNLLKAFDVANKYISDVAQPESEPPMTNPDRDYLQSIIDGEADLSNGDDVEAKLTDISERLNAELEPMFEQAAEAFAQYAIAQAATV